MPTAQMKGESPNCRNHRVLPIPADRLYWGAVGIKSCLYVTHNATQRENFMPTAQMKPHPGPHPRGLSTVSGCGNASCRPGTRTGLAGLARCTRTQCAVMENPSSYVRWPNSAISFKLRFQASFQALLQALFQALVPSFALNFTSSFQASFQALFQA